MFRVRRNFKKLELKNLVKIVLLSSGFSLFITACDGGSSLTPQQKFAFKIADTRNWEETGVLEFGQYDRDEDEIIFDDDDLINFSVDSLASPLLGSVFPTMPTTQFIQFNSPVRGLSLESQIRVYQYAPGSNPDSFSMFERRSLGTRCLGESEDPQGRCVYVDPLDDRTVIVQFPTGYLSDGLYVLFVLNGLKAQNGNFLNKTYYKVLND